MSTSQPRKILIEALQWLNASDHSSSDFLRALNKRFRHAKRLTGLQKDALIRVYSARPNPPHEAPARDDELCIAVEVVMLRLFNSSAPEARLSTRTRFRKHDREAPFAVSMFVDDFWVAGLWQAERTTKFSQHNSIANKGELAASERALVLHAADDLPAVVSSYGIATGYCGVCGCLLADPASIAECIGPGCAKNLG